MPIISGILTDGAGQPVTGCTILLKALNTTSAVIITTTAQVGTDAGRYRIEARPGRYAVTLATEGREPAMVGHIEVRPDSPDGALNDYLRDIKSEDLTTEAMKQFQELASQAREYAERAATSEADAAASSEAAGHSRTAAESSAEQAGHSAEQAQESAEAAGRSEAAAALSESRAADSAAAALESQRAAGHSQEQAAGSEASASDSAGAAGDFAVRAESAQAAAEAAAATVDVHEAPQDGICYVRRNGAWVRQGAFDVGVTTSAGEVDTLAHQLFALDGSQDNTVTFTGLPEGRAMVIALVFHGRGGVITWPDTLAWSFSEPPKLAEIRTIISILWDGETLTGAVALSV